MPVVAHPGPTAPPVPGVRLAAPDSWQPEPAGDALLRASGTGTHGDPVDVVVRTLVGPPGVDPATTATDSAERAAAVGGHGGSEVEDPFVVEIGGREWFARNVTWDEDGAPVVEVHLVTALPAEAVSRHLLVVGRVRGAGLDDDYDALQSVLETLEVEEAGA